jgi:UDPglucose 6-dehydrogenase
MTKSSAIFPQVEFCKDPYGVARDAHALLILTEWPEFRELDWPRFSEAMSRPLVLDGRNLLDPAAMTKLGFEYHCFGRRIERRAQPRVRPPVLIEPSSLPQHA